jgi:hypothetical protein
MKSKEQILDSGILEQYALGLTSEDENREVSQFLDQYPDLKDHLDAIERAMEIIAQQQAIVPPSELRSATINKINEIDAPKASPWPKWITGIAAGVALIAMVYGLKTRSDIQQLSGEVSSLQNQLSVMDNDCSLVKDDYATSQKLLEMYKNDNFLPVRLKGNQMMPQGDLVVFWNPSDKKACLKVNNLQSPPEGYTYQMWADVDGEMLSVGTFKSDAGIIDLKFLEEATSLNVTIEEGEGQEHPNVSKLIMSSKV